MEEEPNTDKIIDEWKKNKNKLLYVKKLLNYYNNNNIKPLDKHIIKYGIYKDTQTNQWESSLNTLNKPEIIKKNRNATACDESTKEYHKQYMRQEYQRNSKLLNLRSYLSKLNTERRTPKDSTISKYSLYKNEHGFWESSIVNESYINKTIQDIDYNSIKKYIYRLNLNPDITPNTTTIRKYNLLQNEDGKWIIDPEKINTLTQNKPKFSNNLVNARASVYSINKSKREPSEKIKTKYSLMQADDGSWFIPSHMIEKLKNTNMEDTENLEK